MKVSESTVRRDIKELEDKGLVIQSQGTIIWNDNSNHLHENIFYRKVQNSDKKKKISLLASKIIEPNETLFIDTGTTMLELVKYIKEDIPLTVVTNDLEIAIELENKYNTTTIMLGGIVKRGTHTIVGDCMNNHIFDTIFFHKSFFSPAGITDEGFSFLNIQAMEIRKKVLEKSEKMIMVADSSKFGKRSSLLGFTFNQCDTLFTDECPPEWYAKISPSLKIVTE